MKKIFTLSFLAILLSGQISAQKAKNYKSLDEIIPASEQVTTSSKQNLATVNSINGIQYLAEGNSLTEKAINAVKHFVPLSNKAENGTLVKYFERNSSANTTIRLQQEINGVKVYKADAAITFNNKNEVVYIAQSLKAVATINTTPSFGESTTLNIAKSYVNSVNTPTFVKSELMVYPNGKESVLVYRHLIGSDNPSGEWEVLVNAHSGQIIKVKDNAAYHKHAQKEEHNHLKFIDGTGSVFEPDPLSSAQVAYGGNYVDNNDAANAELNAETFVRPLEDITFDGTNYSLVGPYCAIVDTEGPNLGLFEQPTDAFIFDRSEDGFEASNVYFHIHSSMKYINETLGIICMPYQYSGGVKCDPHGLNGDDNSHYSSGSGELAWGEGCVDDAEDSDVVHHELGHGIHDWLTAGGLSQVDGLSEGSGDYWAQSYNRSLGNWTSADPAYNYMFNWDGHNDCWAGRITNSTAHYPEDITGGIHADGQIWSTCLMNIYDLIGREKTDRIFLEGLAMTNGSSSQDDAANAAYQAAIDNGYTTAEIQTIYAEFTDCGYILPAPPGPPTADFEADKEVICIDTENMITFNDNSIGVPDTYAWVFPGGTPATSTDPNPTVTYAAAGMYDVELTVSNSFGSNNIVKTDFINIVTGTDCPSCVNESATDLPITLDVSGTPTITSTITVGTAATITDVNIINLQGTHSWINDLTVTLTSPTGTIVTLFDDICGSEDNFDVNFDDAAASGTLPCPPADGNVYMPESPLGAFNGEDQLGDWTLTISDGANLDGGELTNWELEVCTVDNGVGIFTPNVNSNINVYPNPAINSIQIQSENLKNVSQVQLFDVIGQAITLDFVENSNGINASWNNIANGTYVLKISTDNGEIFTKKVTVLK